MREIKKSKKIAIVMTYFERLHQLKKTLSTIEKSRHKTLEVIIVDDASEVLLDLDSVKNQNCEYNFPIHITNISKEEKNWFCPVIAYNRGIEKALTINPDIIILQNAECFHFGDVLSYVIKNLTEENYISFPCFSINKEATFDVDVDKKILSLIEQNDTGDTPIGQNGWYNHNVFRANGYDYCSAITIKNMLKINGYDERYSEGVAWGDDDLIRRVKRAGLQVDIPSTPIVVHQWHYSGYDPYSRPDLYEKNKALFTSEALLKKYKSEHIKTKDFQ